MINWIKCLFKGHDYVEVDRGSIKKLVQIMLIRNESSMKTKRDDDGNIRAFDLICRRCNKIEGFRI